MVLTRTIFIQDGLPTYEDYSSSTGHTWWVSVSFSPSESEHSGEDLMDLAIQRLQAGLFKIKQGTAMHHQHPLYVSFPVDLSLPEDDWVPLAITYAKHYKDDIIAGRISIDSDYLFGSRQL